MAALTLTGGLGAVLYAVSEVPAAGWTSATTLGVGAAGAGLLAAFAAVERHASAPLLPLPVLATRRVLVPNGALFLQSMVGVAWLYVLTLYSQDVLGYGPLAAGLLFLPMTVASVAAAPAAGRLATRFGLRTTASVGLVLVTVGLALMTRMSTADSLAFLLAGMVVGEAGFMLANVPLTIAGSVGTGEDSRGLSAGLLNTATQLGNALGLGVVASVAASVATDRTGGQPAEPTALLDGLQSGLVVCIGFAVAALLVVLVGLRPGTGRSVS